MSNEYSCSIEELLELFNESLSPADVLTSKLMAQISSIITKERMKLSMNQTEFAEYVSATQSQVSRWEHGDYNFSIRKIAEIAVKLNLDVNFTAVNMSAYKSISDYCMEHIVPQTNVIYYTGEKSIPATKSTTYSTKSYSKSIHSKKNKEEYYYASIC